MRRDSYILRLNCTMISAAEISIIDITAFCSLHRNTIEYESIGLKINTYCLKLFYKFIPKSNFVKISKITIIIIIK